MPQSPGYDTTELTSEQVRSLTTEALMRQFSLGVNGYRYVDVDIWNVVLAASAQARAIESASQQMVEAPSGNLVRLYLHEDLLDKTNLAELEAACNELLVARLPEGICGRAHKVAIDLVFLPYYGEPAHDPQEIRRSRAKRGTTRFHCYATAYIIRKNKRLTVAMTYVQAHDKRSDVLKRLLARLAALNIGVRRLYLDRGFASVVIIRYLKQQPFVSILPLPKRGKELKALLTGRKSYRTTYTMTSPKDGSITFPLWIAFRYAKGRRGKHGIDRLAFAVIGDCRSPILQVADEHRKRFGVESSYRLLNKVRARTTSPDPGLRLLFVGIALLLVNMWVYLKWAVLGVPRRGGRYVDDELLSLTRFKDFLLEAVKAIYDVVLVVQRPRSPPRSIKL